MANYSMQYKQYYENIQNKGVKQYTPMAYRQDEISNPYRKIEDGKIKRGNSKNNFISDLINVFVNQLIIVIVMFIAVFYMKYSGTEEGLKMYSIIEQSINNDVDSGEEGSSDLENIIIDAKRYINKIGNTIEGISIE